MFAGMQGVVAWASGIAVVVLVIAILSEGRGRHLLTIVLGAIPWRGVRYAMDHVDRTAVDDWELLGGIDAGPAEPVVPVAWLARSEQLTQQVARQASVVFIRAAEAMASAHARERADDEVRPPEVDVATPVATLATVTAAETVNRLPRRSQIRAAAGRRTVLSPNTDQSPSTGELALSMR